jgi:hypothetical protein
MPDITALSGTMSEYGLPGIGETSISIAAAA